MRVADYIFSRLKEEEEFREFPFEDISGYNNLISQLQKIDNVLKENGRVLFVFFDQFENIFYLQEILRQIKNLLLKISDLQLNIVLSFSWKTDLIVGVSEFPYSLRDDIITSCKPISLNPFTDTETQSLFNKLEAELHTKLRSDLKFFLSEFSQGFPWLLKKLCAHVKVQRESGVIQSEIATSLLNVEELFTADLKGLTPDQEDTLKRIAKIAPMSVQELGEEFDEEVVRSLVNLRLIVRIGSKYDIYWDIFRDFLNTGRLPTQENYILRAQIGSVLKAMDMIPSNKESITIQELQANLRVTTNSCYNIIRDLKLLGIIDVAENILCYSLDLSSDRESRNDELRSHLNDKLNRNRIVRDILNTLESHQNLSIKEMALQISRLCPYITASESTWETYAKTIARWMQFSRLSLYNYKKSVIEEYSPGSEIREREYGVRGRKIQYPAIQYTPIETLALRISSAITNKKAIDWTGFKPSTRYKSLVMLEMLGFTSAIDNRIYFSDSFWDFVSKPDSRAEIFGKKALNIESFKIFIEILMNNQVRISLKELGKLLVKKLNTDWSDSTSEVIVKIMLDWARHSRLAPEGYVRGRGEKPAPRPQKHLTDNLFVQ